jgi:RNA polymerase sigma-70 factor, ECF subfamily
MREVYHRLSGTSPLLAMDQNDASLLKRAKEGSSEAFGSLYDAYSPKIYNYIFYRIRDKEVAEDLTSQSFLKALQNFHTYNEKKGTFSAWIYRIARNTLFDHFRTHRETTDIEEVFGLSAPGSIEKDAETNHDMEKVRELMKELTSEQRDIVIMRIWDGMSYKEIAEVVGKSEANCQMIFSRTVAKLREKMPLALFLLFVMHNIQ